LLLPWTTSWPVVANLILLGAYYAATDGVLMALAGALLPVAQRASGMALLITGTNLMRLAGSILFGVLWTWRGVGFAITLSLAAMVVAMLVGIIALGRGGIEENHGRVAS
jgi:MFS family permease